MIYDGIDIRSVADVKIEDIRVSAIQYAPVARQNTITAGSRFVRNRAGTRTVTVTFALLTSDRTSRQAALMAINQWAKTDKEYRIDVPDHPDHYLVGVCTAKPDPSLRQWWESKLRIVFTCFENPYWNSIVEKSVPCGTPFYAQGDGVPLMRIVKTRASEETDVQYAMNGRTIRFLSVPAGDMVIDINAETAQVGNVSIMDRYNIVSRWIVPAVGLQTVTGSGTVIFRERWS